MKGHMTLFSIAKKLNALALRMRAIAAHIYEHAEEVGVAIATTVAVVGTALAGAALVLLKVVATKTVAATPTLLALV